MTTTAKTKRRDGTEILSVPQVCRLLGVSRQTVWRMVRAGRFPEGHKVPGTRLTGWPREVVEGWLADWKAGRLDD